MQTCNNNSIIARLVVQSASCFAPAVLLLGIWNPWLKHLSLKNVESVDFNDNCRFGHCLIAWSVIDQKTIKMLGQWWSRNPSEHKGKDTAFLHGRHFQGEYYSKHKAETRLSSMVDGFKGPFERPRHQTADAGDAGQAEGPARKHPEASVEAAAANAAVSSTGKIIIAAAIQCFIQQRPSLHRSRYLKAISLILLRPATWWLNQDVTTLSEAIFTKLTKVSYLMTHLRWSCLKPFSLSWLRSATW